MTNKSIVGDIWQISLRIFEAVRLWLINQNDSEPPESESGGKTNNFVLHPVLLIVRHSGGVFKQWTHYIEIKILILVVSADCGTNTMWSGQNSISRSVQHLISLASIADCDAQWSGQNSIFLGGWNLISLASSADCDATMWSGQNSISQSGWNSISLASSADCDTQLSGHAVNAWHWDEMKERGRKDVCNVESAALYTVLKMPQLGQCIV